MNNKKNETMETMKIYDFSELQGNQRRGSVLKRNEVAIYILQRKNGNLINHTLSSSKEADFYKQGKMFLSVGENQITGDIFFIFTDKFTGKEVELRDTNKKSLRVRTNMNTVVRFIANKLGVDTSKGVNEVFSFSDNLSRIPGVISYKIIK